ncbi:glycosyltransferase family 58 protein [Auriscalpium vulgare]|uniref:Glycosyltransferase family 58 protein n=1 Tax=Auriscalpium vulgare TaxID=40419 RepID=A0ACB8SDG0_9AGAM|nr:glycosyltransferase family 58 protein [Auriscalpium vulgare]
MTKFSLSSSLTFARRLLFDPAFFWSLAALVVVGDAVLTQLIIRFVRYTEIDWETYIYQIEVYRKGERDYSKISGPTGPLVYPAGHVHIHEALYHLTDHGSNVKLAQHIYSILYIASLALSCAIYHQAGRLPNWVVLLLPLSKRLHSIFVLRLFNDCWAVVLAQLSILAYAAGLDDVGTLIFSGALSVKMSALLYLPGILVVLVKRRGLATTTRLVMTLVAMQALFAKSFLQEYPWSYVKNAFDLSRIFLYKWTVNWRFLEEDTFLTPTFARTLLLGHATVLVAFGLSRWCRNDGGAVAVIERALRRPSYPAGLTPMTANDVITILFTSNLIGILFARSLHYQFYSWYAQQLPFLAWRTRFPTIVKHVSHSPLWVLWLTIHRVFLLVAIEYSWNVFPSTEFSSGVLCATNALLLAGVWYGERGGIAKD